MGDKTSKETLKFVNAAKHLDRRINNDYPEIAEMYRIASQILSAVGGCRYQKTPKSEYASILDDLNGDKYGIFASVLLKHGVISGIKDFIKSVD